MAGPMPLGTQVTELIKAVKVCKSIFDAFFHQYDNAPARLRELGQLVATFEEILEQNQEIHKGRNTPYSGHDGLKQTLEECSEFLRWYKSVCDKKSHGAKKIVFTALYALDQNKVARLDRQLTRHALPMLLWNSNSLLKWAFDQGEEPPVIQQPDLPISAPYTSGQSDDGDHSRETDTARLELGRFRQEMSELQAKMPRPLQRHENRGMFFREFYDIVSRYWKALHLPTDELLEIFSGDSTVEMSESMTFDTASSALTPPAEVSLTDIKRCKVTISLGMDEEAYNPIQCVGYRVEEDHHQRIRSIIWYDHLEEQVLKHYIPFQTHPHTYHKIHTYERHKVSFLQKHGVSMNRTHLSLEPSYAFTGLLECESFQRFVRNRELLGTFDTNMVKGGIGKLAEFQQVKIWRLDGGDDQPTISFFADRLDYYKGETAKFCEFRLRWFDSVPCYESPKALRLIFNRKNTGLDPQSTKRRFSVGRRRSSSKASSTSPRSSVSLEYTDLIYDTMNTPLITNEEHEDLEYLQIEFSNSLDVHRFIRTSRNAHPKNPLGSQNSLTTSDMPQPFPTNPTSPRLSHPHFRSTSISTGKERAHDPIDSGLSPTAATTSALFSSTLAVGSSSSSTTMPPTPALTNDSMPTPNSGASTYSLQTAPTLPKLQMPPSFYQWEFEDPEME